MSVDLKRKNEYDDDSELLSKKRGVLESDFYPSQVFQGYTMLFLKKPVMLKLQESVVLIKKKYNYKIQIRKVDVESINKILSKYETNLKIGGNDSYINGKTTVFYDGQTPANQIDFVTEGFWMVKITIQGYKCGPTGHATPIWKLDEASYEPW